MFETANLWQTLLLVSFFTLAVVREAQGASLRLNECEQTNYSPCRCVQNEKGTLIYCEGVNPEEVRTVFNRSKSNSDLHFLHLSPSKTATSYRIPADVLNGRRTDYLQIECPSALAKVEIQVDAEAFRSTSTKTSTFDIRDCDLTKMDFNFLRGFNRLDVLTMESCSNIQHSIRTLPLLPALEQLDISMSSGWQGSSFRNLDEVSLQTLKMEDNDDLKDALVQTILKSLSKGSVLSLRSLQLAGNQLTAVPPQVADFNNLNSINLGNNKLTQLSDGQFKFNVPVNRLQLDHNLISSIAPGTFRGDFGSARVFLADNSLTFFEKSVFKSILQQMSKGTGKLYIDTNPYVCDCHLAWLIRDNRDLLKVVEGGACSNGTTFDQLSPDGFNGCDSVPTSTPQENFNESSNFKPKPSSPSEMPPEIVRNHTSETFETTTTALTPSDVSDQTTGVTAEISSTTELVFTTSNGLVSSIAATTETSTETFNVTTLFHAMTVWGAESKKAIKNDSAIPVQSGTPKSVLETTTVMPSIQITRDVTENLAGPTIATATTEINNQLTSTAQTESAFTAEFTNSTLVVSHSQMRTDSTPALTTLTNDSGDAVNDSITGTGNSHGTSTSKDLLTTADSSTLLELDRTTTMRLVDQTTQPTGIPSTTEQMSTLTLVTSTQLPLSSLENLSTLEHPTAVGLIVSDAPESRTDVPDFLTTTRVNPALGDVLSEATETPSMLTTAPASDGGINQSTIKLSEPVSTTTIDLNTTTVAPLTEIAQVTTFEMTSTTIIPLSLSSLPSPSSTTATSNLTSATTAPPTVAKMNITLTSNVSTILTMTTENPAKNTTNATSHMINASVNVTFTAPSESLGHSSPAILTASGVIAKTGSATPILPFSYMAFFVITIVNLTLN